MEGISIVLINKKPSLNLQFSLWRLDYQKKNLLLSVHQKLTSINSGMNEIPTEIPN